MPESQAKTVETSARPRASSVQCSGAAYIIRAKIRFKLLER